MRNAWNELHVGAAQLGFRSSNSTVGQLCTRCQRMLRWSGGSARHTGSLGAVLDLLDLGGFPWCEKAEKIPGLFGRFSVEVNYLGNNIWVLELEYEVCCAMQCSSILCVLLEVKVIKCKLCIVQPSALLV